MIDPLVIHQGHCLTVLEAMPANFVQTVITSPPYWGLRSYGTDPQVWPVVPEPCAHEWDPEGSRHKGGPPGDSAVLAGRDQSARAEMGDVPTGCFCKHCLAWKGELGLEPTIGLYLIHMVQVFREVRRVLRDDGTLWLNLGDSYHNGDKGGHLRETTGMQTTNRGTVKGLTPNRIPQDGLKPKDLIGMPWRVAFALQEDGWYLRSAIPWIKRNPMPESVTDRPGAAVEYVFLFSKAEDYFFDMHAIKLPFSPKTHLRLSQASLQKQTGGSKQEDYRNNEKVGKKCRDRTPMEILKHMAGVNPKAAGAPSGVRSNPSFQSASARPVSARNRRNSDWFFESWQGLYHENGQLLGFVVNPMALKEKHYAAFPPKLVEPCVLAGTSAQGCCPDCGAPWVRLLEKKASTMNIRVRDGLKGILTEKSGLGRSNDEPSIEAQKGTYAETDGVTVTVGWQASCDCHKDPVPCIVLDPFGGSGTTGQVAIEHGRRAVLIELQAEYVELARRRTHVTPGLPLA